MSSRPLLYFPLPPEDFDGWRPVDFADGEGAIQASVRHFVKFVHREVSRELDDNKGGDRDTRVVLARALETGFLEGACSSDSYAFLNQRVARHFSFAEDKDRATDLAFQRLINLLTSIPQRWHVSFQQQNLSLIVFVRYKGEGVQRPAYFQPWVRVRDFPGGSVTFPPFNLDPPMRIARRYVPAIDPTAMPSQPAATVAERPSADRIGSSVTSDDAVPASPAESPIHGRTPSSSSEADDPATGYLNPGAAGGDPDPGGRQEMTLVAEVVAPVQPQPAPRPHAHSELTPGAQASSTSAPPATWLGQKMLDMLMQDLLDERRESRRTGSIWANLGLLLGTFGCLVAAFHLVMYILEAKGFIARGP